MPFMQTLQIMLSESSQRFIQGRTAELGLDSPEQYVEQLLEEEQRRSLDEYYMEKVREGLASGTPIPVTPGYWQEIASRVERKVEERNRKATG
jgi:hypothetical protein